jgi:hypothetical protein
MTRIIPYPTKTATSRATTGRRLFTEGGDGRSAWGRRWRDLCLSHANDLGGPDGLSEAQVSIIKRVSAMEIELEAMEARMSEGERVDLDQFGRLTGRLCRLLELVGIRRVTKPLDPTGELARAFAGVDDDGDEDEPLPIEEGLDREPGEA